MYLCSYHVPFLLWLCTLHILKIDLHVFYSYAIYRSSLATVKIYFLKISLWNYLETIHHYMSINYCKTWNKLRQGDTSLDNDISQCSWIINCVNTARHYTNATSHCRVSLRIVDRRIEFCRYLLHALQTSAVLTATMRYDTRYAKRHF